jgi:hypothetical protein
VPSGDLWTFRTPSRIKHVPSVKGMCPYITPAYVADAAIRRTVSMEDDLLGAANGVVPRELRYVPLHVRVLRFLFAQHGLWHR